MGDVPDFSVNFPRKEDTNADSGSLGVPYFHGKPGVAKTNLGKSIADRMGWDYLDLRVSMNAEIAEKHKYKPTLKQRFKLKLARLLMEVANKFKKLSKRLKR